MVRRASTEKFERIEHLRDRITLHQGDLLDQRSLVDALRAARPDEIYNLAAMSFVAVSWVQPTLTAEFTGVGVTRMLEAMREVCPEARFYQASSSEMFGKVREVRRPRRRRSTRARRTASRRPTGTSSRSTTASRTTCTRAAGSSSTTSRRAAASSSSRARSPGTRRRSSRARRPARAGQPRRRARLGLREGLRRGDVAHAPAGRARATTSSRRTRRTACASASRSRSTRPASATGSARRIDPPFLRPAEVDHLIGDYSKAERELGWRPRTSFEELIRLMTRADLELPVER